MQFNGITVDDAQEVALDGAVRCAADGRVVGVFVEKTGIELASLYGNSVIVESEDGTSRIYHHLFKHPGRAIGDTVLAGQLIGFTDVPEPARRSRKKAV